MKKDKSLLKDHFLPDDKGNSFDWVGDDFEQVDTSELPDLKEEDLGGHYTVKPPKEKRGNSKTKK